LKRGMWVKEVAIGRKVDGLFLVKEKKLLQGRTGRPYVMIRLADKTGEVEARIWDRVEELQERFQVGDLISVSGDVSEYQGSLQVKIQELENRGPLIEEGLEEFLPDYLSQREASERRMGELRRLVMEIRDEELRGLVLEFLEDPELSNKWLIVPAAKRLHHARLGGLLEHTLSVVKLAILACDHYPGLDKDILVAGAALHDIGKLHELKEPWKPDYTTEGRLLGHLIIGLEMLDRALERHPGVSPLKALVLKHMLASHHGELEFGSPKRPKVLEALVLYMLDDLDAKVDGFVSHLRSEGVSGDGWTGYNPILERHIFGGLSPARYSRLGEKGDQVRDEDSAYSPLGTLLGGGEEDSGDPGSATDT
jgi:3'-5' exoribonuclease